MTLKTPYLVSIYLYGDQLNPAEVTNMLGTKPTTSWRKGDKKIEGRPYIANTGLWTLKSQSSSCTLDDHILNLVEMLKARSTGNITTIPGVECARCDIFVLEPYKQDGDRSVWFTINASTAMAIAEIGLELEFTVDRVITPD